MIDRRTVLAAIGCAAASAPFTGFAGAVEQGADLPSCRLAYAIADARAAGAMIETLHRVSDLHPGFSYYAGFPGNLGMPFPDLVNWFATDDARTAWLNLQKLCDVTCLIVGSTPAQTGIAASLCGTPAQVSGALYAAHHSDCDFTVRAIAPHGTTMALTMPRRAWQRLDDAKRSAMIAHAARMTRTHIAQYKAAPAISATIHTAAVNRVSEAVIAELANHDELTRRINSCYFSFKEKRSGLRSKNVV